MTPTPLLLVVAVFLVLVRVVWWLVARDRMFLGVPNASAAQQPDVGDCPPAVAALALSGADGGACFLLDQAASAAIANLVTQGVLAAQVHDDDALFSLRNVDDVSVDDALLIRMLRTRMTRTADGTEVVDSGTIAHHQPNALWWLRYRRAVTLRARELGVTQARPKMQTLLVLAAIAAIVGITGVVVGLLAFVRAFSDLDPLSLDLWWPLVGVIALRVSSDAFRTAVERSDLLTTAGRNYTMRLAHRRDQLANAISSADGVGGSADVAAATAAGIQTRVTRQIPLYSAHHERLIWSDHSGSLRLVRVRRDWRPGEGTHASSAIIGGLFTIAIAIIVRRVEHAVSASDLSTSLALDSPSAVSNVEQLFSLIRQLTLVPLVGGSCLALAGVIDLFATTTFSGKVIDVQLPETHHLAQRARAFFAGAGHDGIAVVEVTVDLDDAGGARTFLVDARAAAPIGAEVSVEQTLLLRRVRSIAPRGRSGAEPISTPTIVA